MSLYRSFKTNANAQEKGVPLEFQANDDGTIPTFYVARMSAANPNYAKVVEDETAPYKQQIRLGVLTEATAKEMWIRIFCRAGLTGWQNVRDEADKPLEYTLANAVKLMGDLPELYERLKAHADDMRNYLAANLETTAKN